MPDGNIEYIGRKDRQIKINSLRIELDAIENALLSSKLVNDAAVVCIDEGGDKFLCAYIANKYNDDVIDKIKDHLHEKLPSYMVPAKFVVTDSLQRNRNGKINWSILKQTESKLKRIIKTKPSNDKEEKMLEIWEDILKCSDLDVNSNFFESGGNSIKALHLLMQLEIEGYQLKINDIYQYPTVKKLTDYLSDGSLEELFIDKTSVANSIQPFNDVFFMNCFYHSLFPILSLFGIPNDSILINDVIFYNCLPSQNNFISYEPVQSTESIIRALPVFIEEEGVCSDIIERIKLALPKEKYCIVWIDSFYNPNTANQFKTLHHPHSILIYGCNDSNQTFNIIEHTDLNALNYSHKTISFSDLAIAYDSFIKEFYNSKTSSFYTLSMNSDIVYSFDTISVFQRNFFENEQKIIQGLSSLQIMNQEYFGKNMSEEIKNDLETLMEGINEIINAKKIEYYRNKKIFQIIKFPANITESIIEKWSILRIILTKNLYSKKNGKLDISLCYNLVCAIIELEKAYYNSLKLSFDLEKKV